MMDQPKNQHLFFQSLLNFVGPIYDTEYTSLMGQTNFRAYQCWPIDSKSKCIHNFANMKMYGIFEVIFDLTTFSKCVTLWRLMFPMKGFTTHYYSHIFKRCCRTDLHKCSYVDFILNYLPNSNPLISPQSEILLQNH